jgi:glycosyltransferase involved in cell wall biosynthesis
VRPSVSVVIPYFNAEKTLPEAVESVLAQTFSSWELVLVDDGSTDGGPSVARAFARLHPRRIRCAAHPRRANRGAFAARVLGARKAEAGVLALLDADDAWEPEYLETHFAFFRRMREKRVALSYGPAHHWLPGDASGRSDFIQEVPARRETVFAPGALLQNFLSGAFATVPKPSCCLVRRDALLSLAFFSAAAKRSPTVEDWFLSWGVGARWPIAVHTRALVRYRRKHALDRVPKTDLRRMLREESFALPILRDYVERHLPGHTVLRPEGIDARLAGLRDLKRLPPLGGHFLRRIPKGLLRLSHGR